MSDRFMVAAGIVAGGNLGLRWAKANDEKVMCDAQWRLREEIAESANLLREADYQERWNAQESKMVSL